MPSFTADEVNSPQACNRVSNGPTSPLVNDVHLPFPQVCKRINDRINAFLEEKDVSSRLQSVQEQTRNSLAVIEEALDKYTLPQLSLAYNGGKDCLVLLILYLCALHRKSLTTTPHPIQCVYIQAPAPFPEVESFVASSVRTYSLSLLEYNKPMKAAFADYLHDVPTVRAIFVGTRRTDPHGENLRHFDPTDHGWPAFMRVHPVIDWHYVDIWTFIRHLKIPYCELYDRGYTSLGGSTDTHPNPVLARQPSTPDSSTVNGAAKPKFRPAYELVDDEEERLGRDSR
ncbi:adenine nucleotide alpha hydrolases-like protein [Westerdykella ornata]|uniref:FAD synthase n=1 Tax=Westerdykella ornata TaxID=318751 RepID=A0A6A6JBM1_WESOR|nr:adenine nucleotide alpha hydrolases-like protein [Westerdykella ornata]KAF2273036.1 adenine nucleotide alpha hydrolases-like protein [Westerdykella ornata]